MKKYFLMFATFAAALTMMSCEKDKGNTGNGGNGGGEPNPPTDELKLNLDEAVYYGEKIAADVGYYSMTFVVDGTSNKLRLDMFASVVDPVSTPKLTAGTYDLGTITEPTSKTYFVASNGSDTEGTLYWKEGTAVLVTGGSINVQSAAGGYTIKVNLTAGDETIEAKYSGSISFDDQRQDAPRTPITANAYLAQYTGECMLANEQLGQMTLLMQDAENTNQQIQLVMTVPYPTEGDYPADNVPIPTGTFEVVEGNPTAAGQIIPTSNDVAEGTYSAEIVYNSGVISYGVLIQGGTVTIAKEGETYNVTTALEGTKFSYSNNKLQLGQHVTDIVWNLTGAQFGDYAVDMTNPMSSLTENKELTDLTGVFADPWGVPGTNNYIWRIILHNEDLVIDANNPYYNQDGTLYVSGEGDAMMMQLITSSASEFPVGTFNVENTYDYVYPVGNTLSGKPILNVGGADPLGLGVGTWYYYIGPNDEGQMAVLDGAGAVIKQGSINITTSDNKTYNIAVDIFDKYGHNITGTFAVTVDSGQASFSSNDATDSVVRTMPNTSFVPYSFEQHSGLAISF